jgi:DNA-binding transcriptional MerR regulator
MQKLSPEKEKNDLYVVDLDRIHDLNSWINHNNNTKLFRNNHYLKPKSCVIQKKNRVGYWSCTSCYQYKNGNCEGDFKSPAERKNQEKFQKIYNQIHLGRVLALMGKITKEDLKETLKERFNIIVTNRSLQWYSEHGLISSSVQRRVDGLRGSVAIFEKDTVKLIYAIDRLKKLGVKIKLNDIKYYLNLMKFFSKQETYQNEDTIKKLDILTFQELKNLKMEDTFVKGIILSDKYTKKQKNKVIKEFPVFHTEITFLTRWDLLEELIEALAYASLDFEEIKELRKKYEDWQIEPVLDNPAIETNIDLIDEKNIEQTFIFAKYDKPVSKTVYFKYHEIEVL